MAQWTINVKLQLGGNSKANDSNLRLKFDGLVCLHIQFDIMYYTDNSNHAADTLSHCPKSNYPLMPKELFEKETSQIAKAK